MGKNYPLSVSRSNILGTEAFRNLLGESLKKSKTRIVILSAYVKKIGVKWLKDQIIDKDINCTIVSRWEKGDLATGSSDLDCYEICKQNNWEFKILNDLHAKVMLIDDKDLFIGSPNLTGSGMSLIPVSNKELGIKIEATESDIKTIDGLIEDAILVNDEIYNYLKQWKDKLPEIIKPSIPDYPESLKNKLKENINKIWVHNFPWVTAEELLEASSINENLKHDLELFGLEKDNLEKNIIKKNLLNSKIYFWLTNQIRKQENHEIYFGNLSSIIHNSLLDDPKPYRKNVKELQANLYTYVKFFLEDYIIIDVPYEKSERLRLIN
tara:strand:- start:5972 stop:6943 length:972 start_codon:yes stop_codon:yes gene_type:complete